MMRVVCIDMKSNGYTDDSVFEQHLCKCGTWFIITIDIDRDSGSVDMFQMTTNRLRPHKGTLLGTHHKRDGP